MKLAILIGMALLVGNAKADVVGLKTTTTTTIPGPRDYANGDNFLTVNFSTTGNSGNKFTAVSFDNLGLGSGTLSFTANLKNSGGVTVATENLTYTNAGGLINFTGQISNYGWQASSSFSLQFDINQTGGASFSNYTRSLGPEVTISIPDWVNTADQSANVGYPGVAFTLYATVPEPGSMILTGAALGAGALWGFLKRRRRAALKAR